MGSSWARSQACVPCTAWQILNHCTTRKAPKTISTSRKNIIYTNKKLQGIHFQKRGIGLIVWKREISSSGLFPDPGSNSSLGALGPSSWLWGSANERTLSHPTPHNHRPKERESGTQGWGGTSIRQSHIPPTSPPFRILQCSLR